MWFTASSVTAANNSNVVKINSNESIANVKPGDALIIGSFNPVEIQKAYVSEQGSFIQLVNIWSNATQQQIPALVLPTKATLNDAINAINSANKLVNDNYKSILDWQTKSGEVIFKDLDGNEIPVKTAKQLELDVNAVHPYPWAFRTKDIEAIRAQNMAKYEASGFVHFGKNHSSLKNISQGMYAYPAITNRLRLGRAGSAATGESETDYPVVHIAGVLINVEYLSSATPSYSVEIKCPEAENGTRTYDSATGLSVTHATPALAFAAETDSNKVVTDRVDALTFELALREINAEHPNVYAFGLAQSQANNINGVPTTLDDTRPDTYFAQYKGDTTSRGRRVNWLTASEAERIAIGSDINNWIYFDDSTGKWYQWTLKALNFAGLGNGDWHNIDATKATDLSFTSNSALSSISAQGVDDTDEGLGYYTSNAQNASYNIEKGLFGTAVYSNGKRLPSSKGVDGHCYLLVYGTVNRLNMGIYSPKNPFGTAAIEEAGYGFLTWDRDRLPDDFLATKADHFGKVDGNFKTLTGINGSIAGGTGRCGHPNGRYYDAIYSSGQGGVCRDMRYSANGLSLEDFAEHDLKVKSGEYRGLEKLFKVQFKFSTPFYFSNVNANSNVYFRTGANNTGVLFDFESNGITSGASVIVYQPQTGYVGYGALHSATGHIKLLSNKDNLLNRSSGSYVGSMTKVDYCYILEVEPICSVADEYLHADVIGDPANILLCDDLKDGWIGGYLGTPSGIGNMNTPFSKPAIENLGSYVQFDATGNILSAGSMGIDLVKNKNGGALLNIANRVSICTYKTKAKLTKPANVAAIYKAHAGIGNVFLTQNYVERDLCYSLTGKIITRSSHARSECTVPLNNHGRLLNGKFLNTSHRTFDIPSSFPASDNNSPAIMALNYVVEQNGMAVINYAYAELKFDFAAGDWGCDGNVSMINGQSIMIDDNGNTVKVGTAQIVEPLGWVKRAS